jgi:hypothetical protein
MVQINDDHKIQIASKNKTHFEWLDENGNMRDINVTTLTDDELFILRNQMKAWFNEQMGVIDDEINRWEPVYCAVCGQEDLAFRGKPFVTWGMRGGYPLCPRHTMRFDLMGTPAGEQLRKAKEEEREIKELFG